MSRTIPPQLRRQVWEAHMVDPRSTYGPCFVCRGEIHYSQFECGHVISHVNGGDISVDNLRPICGSCNKSMGPRNLFEYKAEFFSADSNGSPLARPLARPLHLSQAKPVQPLSRAKPKKVKPIEPTESEGSSGLPWLLSLFKPTPFNSPKAKPTKAKPAKAKSTPSNPTKAKPIKAKPTQVQPDPDGLDEVIRGFVNLTIGTAPLNLTGSGCGHILLSGKRQGQPCGKPIKDGTGGYCYDHDPTNPCRYILVSGKRRGQFCGKPARNGPYCSRHNLE